MWGKRREKGSIEDLPLRTLSWWMWFINKPSERNLREHRNKCMQGALGAWAEGKIPPGGVRESFPEEVMSDLCQKR